LRQANPALFEALLDRITKATILYLSQQIQAGAEVVKIFDSWAGSLQGDDFEKYALEPCREITAALKAKYPTVPVIGFPRGAGDKNIGFAKATGVDCVALDNGLDAIWAATNVQVDGCVQGNLDPSHMVTGGQPLIDATRAVVQAFAKGPHIFNLGHGITPDADPANVQLMVDTVRGA
jgi:uroporphyrinogen decarboxylase